MGYPPHPTMPGYYQGDDGILRNQQGAAIEQPQCAACGDGRLVKILPLSRVSRGPWDWELVACENCMELVNGHWHRIAALAK